MSVLALSVPEFLVRLELRRRPDLADKPYALIGPDDHVWAASKEARDYGVADGLAPAHARARCRNLVICELDEGEAGDQQQAFLDEIGSWELPAEETGYGRAFIALDGVADTASEAQPLAAEMGARLRRTLGEALTPAIGFDHGKFTAGAAADIAGSGRMRLISREDEPRFLNPLSVALLPLTPKPISYLGWLGIATLGQFSGLPTEPLVTRFGPAMRMMQQWARGRDRRPVVATVRAAAETLTCEYSPPTGSAERVAAELTRALKPALRDLARVWRGVQRLRVRITFANSKSTQLELRFRAPASGPDRLETALLRQLAELSWRGGVSAASAQILRTAELSVAQNDLFFEAEMNPAPGARAPSPAAEAVVAALSRLYPGALLRYRALDPTHPAAERRGEYVVREPDGGAPVERTRPLVAPASITVLTNDLGEPTRMGDAQDIIACEGSWRVATDWWSEAGAVNRTYYRVTIAEGASVELFYDHLAGAWMLSHPRENGGE